MDTQSSSRRALKPAQEQEVAEDWRQPRNETERLSLPCATETSEQSEKAKRGRTRHAVQSGNEIKATLQWKSTRERGAETPEQRETRNGS